MKKSFLFNISEQEGLPGGPNEVNNNLLGSLSVSQNVYIPYNNAGPRASINDDVNEDAMRGMMKARMAYEEMHGNPAAKRMVVAPDNPYQFDNGDIGTHYMGSYDDYAVPNIQEVDGKLEMTGPIANEEMKFDRPEDAAYFAEHYKDIAPDPSYREYKKGGDNSKKKKGDDERTYETSDPEEYEKLQKEYDAQLRAYNRYKDFYEVDDPYNPTAFRGVGENKTPYLATEDYLLDQHGVQEGYFPLGKKVIGPDGVPYILGQYLKGKPGESLESHTTSNPAYPVTHTLFDHDLNEGIGTINWNIDDPNSSTHKYHWDSAFENSVTKGDMRYAYEGDKITAEEEGLPKPLGYAYGIASGGAPDIPIYAKPVKPVYKHATLPLEEQRQLESNLPNQLITKPQPRQNLHKEYNPYTQQYEVMSPSQKHILDRAKYLGQDAPEFTGEPLDTNTMRPLQGVDLFKYRMQNNFKFEHGGPGPHPKETPNKILTLEDNSNWFDSRARYSDNQTYDDQIRERVYSGNWGYNPYTQSLHKLNTNQKTKPTEEQQLYKEDKKVVQAHLNALKNQDNKWWEDPSYKPTQKERDEFIKMGVEKTINNPAFTTAAYFTPPGMAIGAMQGAGNLIKDTGNNDLGLHSLLDASMVAPAVGPSIARGVKQMLKPVTPASKELNAYATNLKKEIELLDKNLPALKKENAKVKFDESGLGKVGKKTINKLDETNYKATRDELVERLKGLESKIKKGEKFHRGPYKNLEFDESGFVKNIPDEIYHGSETGAPITLNELQLDRKKLDPSQFKTWTESSLDKDYGLFGARKLTQGRNPALKYSNTVEDILKGIAKNPKQKLPENIPGDWMSNINLSKDAKILKTDTKLGKQIAKEFDILPNTSTSGQTKITEDIAKKIKDKYNVDGFYDKSHDEFLILNKNAISDIKKRPIKVYDYVDPIKSDLSAIDLLRRDLRKQVDKAGLTALDKSGKFNKEYMEDPFAYHENLLKRDIDKINTDLPLGFDPSHVNRKGRETSDYYRNMFSPNWQEQFMKVNPTYLKKYGGSIPEMNLGGLFGKKKSSGEYKPGSWAGNDNSEVKIYQEGEDAFDIPISKTPEAEFSLPEMSEEELQAYLIQSEKDEFERKYKAAYDQYKPETVSYKGIERPKAEFVLAEQYEANPQLYQDAGYTANKLESGNYELFQNKDISNMIYAKGFKPGVFENTYGMGSGEDIEKKFAPIYADAKRIHAERNAKKIDAMLKETVDAEPEDWKDFDVNRMDMSEGARYSAGKAPTADYFQSKGYRPTTKPKYQNVEEVIDVLVSQGEGTKEGLTQRYMDYTNGLLKERDFDENLRNEAERIYEDRFKKKRDDLADQVDSWKPESIASVDQPILTPVKDISGNIEWKDNTAYSKNLDAITEYQNYIDNELQSTDYVAREALYAIANNEDLTVDQKKELLGDPEKLGNVMKSYAEYRAAPAGAPDAGYSGYYRGGNLKSDFNIDPENLEANWAAGTMPHVIDGGVDMLDEGWIKGTVGVIGAPAAFEALGSAMSYNLGNLVGAGSSTPAWLNMGNVFTGMGVKDVVTDIVPSAIENVQSMRSDGINKENTFGLAKDIFEGSTKLLSGTKLLNSMGVLKNAPKITNTSGYNTAKSIYGQGKYGTRIMAEELANNDHNVTDNMKFIKNLGIYMKGKKQYGGPTYAELTDAEIKKYREGGWIIEEI